MPRFRQYCNSVATRDHFNYYHNYVFLNRKPFHEQPEDFDFALLQLWLSNVSLLPCPQWPVSEASVIVTKNQDDGLQIIEQILPFFNPDFCVSITDIPEMGIKRDLQIILENVSYEDNYEGEFTQRQSIVWNLTFNLGLNFYGPVDMQGYIKTAIANTYANINPDADTQEKIKYQVTYTPNDASYLDDWNYVEQFDEAYE